MPLRTGLATLGGAVAAWDRRVRFRRDLEQTSKNDPHLIADIGLTEPQVEIESAKRFWQA